MNKIEKIWYTEEGYKAVVRRVSLEDEYPLVLKDIFKDYRVGYVGVPEGHPLWCKSLWELPRLDVHGGVTFTELGKDNYPSEGEFFWIGFDCAHSGDEGGRSFHYVVNECEKLSKQLGNCK